MVSQVGLGTKTFYVFAGNTLIGEVNGAGVVQAAYTWGVDGLVSERLVPSSRSLWYHSGPQGETRQLTDSSGSVADAYVYSAYGQPVASTGTDANPFRFGGRHGCYTDGAAVGGLVLCTYRWYDPNNSRWLSRDPIGYEGGDNLYAYVGGNPVHWSDPAGLEGRLDWIDSGIIAVSTTIGGIEGGILGGGLGAGGGTFVCPGVGTIAGGVAGTIAGAGAGATLGAGIGVIIVGLRHAGEATITSVRGPNKLEPDPGASGEHTTYRRGSDGRVRNYVDWKPNAMGAGAEGCSREGGSETMLTGNRTPGIPEVSIQKNALILRAHHTKTRQVRTSPLRMYMKEAMYARPGQMSVHSRPV